jgi:hypothetical protein
MEHPVETFNLTLLFHGIDLDKVHHKADGFEIALGGVLVLAHDVDDGDLLRRDADLDPHRGVLGRLRAGGRVLTDDLADQLVVVDDFLVLGRGQG